MAAQDYHNILVFSFTFIGDAVLSTCVIEPLRKTYPNAQLSFLAGHAARAVLDGDPQIDQTLLYDSQEHRGLLGKRVLLTQLRRHRFDLVIDLRDSLWSRWVRGERWGIRDRTYEAHAVVRYLSTLRGIDTMGATPHIVPTAEETRAAKQYLGSRRKRHRIVMHPGANWRYKRWSTTAFAELANRLVDALDAELVLIAGPDEQQIVQAVAERMKVSPLILNEISLREVAAVVSLCDHYIGNDTGPMHLAAAVGTSVTALFASTDHRRSGPYGDRHQVILSERDLGCQPCHPGKHPGGCGKDTCAVMDAISIDQVFQVVCARIDAT